MLEHTVPYKWKRPRDLAGFLSLQTVTPAARSLEHAVVEGAQAAICRLLTFQHLQNVAPLKGGVDLWVADPCQVFPVQPLKYGVEAWLVHPTPGCWPGLKDLQKLGFAAGMVRILLRSCSACQLFPGVSQASEPCCRRAERTRVVWGRLDVALSPPLGNEFALCSISILSQGSKDQRLKPHNMARMSKPPSMLQGCSQLLFIIILTRIALGLCSLVLALSVSIFSESWLPTSTNMGRSPRKGLPIPVTLASTRQRVGSPVPYLWELRFQVADSFFCFSLFLCGAGSNANVGATWGIHG